MAQHCFFVFQVTIAAGRKDSSSICGVVQKTRPSVRTGRLGCGGCLWILFAMSVSTPAGSTLCLTPLMASVGVSCRPGVRFLRGRKSLAKRRPVSSGRMSGRGWCKLRGARAEVRCFLRQWPVVPRSAPMTGVGRPELIVSLLGPGGWGRRRFPGHRRCGCR